MQRLGIDTGGTFTDIVLWNEEVGYLEMAKVKSMPRAPEQAVLAAIEKIGTDLETVGILIHGTTIALNTLVTKKGAKVGLITTKGFRDVLEMGRGNKEDLFSYFYKKPDPLVPRFLRQEVRERTLSDGTILIEPDEGDVRKAVEIFKENGVEAIAVCLLHSYINPSNELKVANIIKRLWPNVSISLSHLVAREIREFERTSTTVINAYIQKSVATYLDALANSLHAKGFQGKILVLGPSGLIGPDVVRERAIYALSSGPIAGAMGAAYWADKSGISNVITIDVGGTTADMSLIKAGKNIRKYELNVAGYPILLPTVDVRSIGAGGGSVAKVEKGGILAVGPESAGAEPGPICYGQGGEFPTVTDAAVVTGLIDADNFLGGELKVAKELALEGLRELGRELSVDEFHAAYAVLEVCASNMAEELKRILAEYGEDPRDYTLFAFGGAGGLFAAEVAREIGISKVIIPPMPSVFSAWGLLLVDAVYIYTWGVFRPLEDVNFKEMNSIFYELEKKAAEEISIIQPLGNVSFIKTVEMCYQGQHRMVELLWPDSSDGDPLQILGDAFVDLHRKIYGHFLKDTPVWLVNARLTALCTLKKAVPSFTLWGKTVTFPYSSIKKRSVFMNGDWVTFDVYKREFLKEGTIIKGPAIIEESSHTTVVKPGDTVVIDRFGNMIIYVKM